MFSSRTNLTAALEGQKPERIPFTFYYEDFITEDPAWDGLIAQGLTPISWSATTRQISEDVEKIVRKEYHNDIPSERITLRTSVGEISQYSVQGWVQEYFLKTPHDYRVMEHIIRHTHIQEDPQNFLKNEERLEEKGLSLVYAGRSPMQVILVDYAGLENFSYHLAEGFPEFTALAEALMDQLTENCRLIANGPGRYVSLLENLTAETWGPRRFAKYHMPVYERILPILHAGGKKVYTHFDGKLACLADLIAQTEIDGIESLTQAPEGDLDYNRARQTWPNKFIWANINVSLYNLPWPELKGHIIEMAHKAAPDGRLLAFEISEDRPENWRDSIPIVLETLENLH